MCAKKMILVDPLKLQRTENISKPIRDGLATSISYLDQEMSDILSNNNIDDRTKAQAYQQILQRYIQQSEKYQRKPLGRLELSSEKKLTNENDKLFKDDKQNTPQDGNTTSGSDFNTRVLKSIPNNLKGKASLLLDYLKANPDIEWDKKDQLIVNSQTVDGTNAVDLVNDLLRVRKTVRPPIGWDTLASTLKKSNIPREVIGNSDRWAWMERTRKDRRSTPRHKTNKPSTQPSKSPSTPFKWETFN